MRKLSFTLLATLNLGWYGIRAVSYTDMDLGIYSSRLFSEMKKGATEPFAQIINELEKEERAHEKMQQLFEYVDDNGDCLLHGAIKNPNASFLETILKVFVTQHQCNVNMPTAFDSLPLYLAATRNRGAAIQMLCNAGSCINWQGDRKETLLHVAARHNSYDVVRVLLRLGLKANVQDERGITPMHIAILDDSYDVVRALLAYSSFGRREKRELQQLAEYYKRHTIVKLLNASEVQ